MTKPMCAQTAKPASPRSVVLDLLDSVLRLKRPLDDALQDHPELPGMEPRDRAFTRLLVATTFRRLGQLDDLIDRCLERPLPAKAKDVRDLLRLGACQLLFLDTPAHAAVSTAVDLAQDRGHGPHKALINAVLRRLGREGAEIIQAQDAARMNTPDWLWDSWVGAYGEPLSRRIADAHLSEAPLDITVKSDLSSWAKALDAQVLLTGTLRRNTGGRINELPGFEAGAWWVQDAAATLPVKLLGDVEGSHVIDLCAAPGGKTAQLASRGARITAVDRSEKRLARLRANLDRLGLDADLVAADAVSWRPEKQGDAVLLDAPCSATGTIRRHPDVARLKTADDVIKLAKVQDRLLSAAVEMVRPGGVVVYCSCSLQPEEGPERIKAALGSGLPMERAPIQPAEMGGMEEMVSPEGDLRTLPSHFAGIGGMDGFFAARLKRL